MFVDILQKLGFTFLSNLVFVKILSVLNNLSLSRSMYKDFIVYGAKKQLK